jgi:hypothetical protein
LGCNGFGVAIAAVTTGDDFVAGVCVSDARLTVSVGSSFVASAGGFVSCLTSESGAGVFVLVGFAAAASESFFFFGGLMVSLVPFTGGFAVSLGAIAGPSAADVVASGLVVFASESDVLVVDPVVPPVSSAHARPVVHPVVTAAAIARATAKPPTRLTYALRGIRYVYRRRTNGAAERRRVFAQAASRYVCR